MEHNLRMDSYEESSECLWENSKKIRVLRPQFLQNTELSFEYGSMSLQYVADKSVFISYYPL